MHVWQYTPTHSKWIKTTCSCLFVVRVLCNKNSVIKLPVTNVAGNLPRYRQLTGKLPTTHNPNKKPVKPNLWFSSNASNSGEARTLRTVQLVRKWRNALSALWNPLNFLRYRFVAYSPAFSAFGAHLLAYFPSVSRVTCVKGYACKNVPLRALRRTELLRPDL